MALRSGYKGFKKLLPGLKILRPGTLGIDNDVLIPELNKTFFPRSEQVVLGAKNLVDVSITVPNLTASVVFLNNGFTVSGTSMTYTSSYTSLDGLKVGEDYIASVDVTASDNSDARIAIRNSSGIVQYSKIIGNNTGHYELEFVYQEGYYFSVMANYSTEATASITVDNVMIRLASDLDSTYVPYAMTNKGLTDNKRVLKEEVNRLDQKTGRSSSYGNGVTTLQTIASYSPIVSGTMFLLIIKHFTSATTFIFRLGIVTTYTEDDVMKWAWQMLIDDNSLPAITAIEQISDGNIKLTFASAVYAVFNVLKLSN